VRAGVVARWRAGGRRPPACAWGKRRAAAKCAQPPGIWRARAPAVSGRGEPALPPAAANRPRGILTRIRWHGFRFGRRRRRRERFRVAIGWRTRRALLAP